MPTNQERMDKALEALDDALGEDVAVVVVATEREADAEGERKAASATNCGTVAATTMLSQALSRARGMKPFGDPEANLTKAAAGTGEEGGDDEGVNMQEMAQTVCHTARQGLETRWIASGQPGGVPGVFVLLVPEPEQVGQQALKFQVAASSAGVDPEILRAVLDGLAQKGPGLHGFETHVVLPDDGDGGPR